MGGNPYLAASVMANITDLLNGSEVTEPARSLDTPFVPSTTRWTECYYSIHVNSGSVGSNSSGSARVELFMDENNPPIRSWGDVGVTNSRSIFAGGSSSKEVDGVLYVRVPPGHFVHLVSSTTGFGVATLTFSREVLL